MRAAVSLDDPVALADASHRAPEARHRAAELVAEHHRHLDRPGLGVARLVHVRAADRHRPDLEQHVVVADVGIQELSRSSTASGARAY